MIWKLPAALVAMALIGTGCSGGGSAAAATPTRCAHMAGTPVPLKLKNVNCAGGSVAAVSFGCYRHGRYVGKFFVATPYAFNGTKLGSVAGRPGRTWLHAAHPNRLHETAALVGCNG